MGVNMSSIKIKTLFSFLFCLSFSPTLFCEDTNIQTIKESCEEGKKAVDKIVTKRDWFKTEVEILEEEEKSKFGERILIEKDEQDLARILKTKKDEVWDEANSKVFRLQEIDQEKSLENLIEREKNASARIIVLVGGFCFVVVGCVLGKWFFDIRHERDVYESAVKKARAE
jgi:hypothetical protein